MGVVVGVDQGSTKTAAVVVDFEGNVLGSGYAHGACHAVHGLEHAMAAVMEACGTALQEAGLGIAEVEIVSAGMTGADWLEEYIFLREAVYRAVGVPHIVVHNDCIAALRGGTDHQSAAVICSGTGLNIGVRRPDGESWAFGYNIDIDLLGISALKAVFAAEAGVAQPTILTSALLDFYGETDVDSLLRRYVKAELYARIADLTPIVIDAAAGGDGAACTITADYARRSAEYVSAALRRFGMLHLCPDVVLSGSVFKSKHMREITDSAVRMACASVRIVDALYEPVIGAALLALDDRSGKPLSDAINENIRRSSATHGLLRL